MNETLLTISLLIIVVCNLGVLWLYFQTTRFLESDDSLKVVSNNLVIILNRLSEAADRQRGMKQVLLEDGKLTRERIAQVKTRLADEERVNQKELAKARREGVRS